MSVVQGRHEASVEVTSFVLPAAGSRPLLHADLSEGGTAPGYGEEPLGMMRCCYSTAGLTRHVFTRSQCSLGLCWFIL